MTEKFTTTGPVRGTCGHKHRSMKTAVECLKRDIRGCASQGGYSDRRVVAIDEDGDTTELETSESMLESFFFWHDRL